MRQRGFALFIFCVMGICDGLAAEEEAQQPSIDEFRDSLKAGGINTSRAGINTTTRHMIKADAISIDPVGSRTDEEIHGVFEKNRNNLFAIYQRRLRHEPTLAGSVWLKVSVENTGKVLDCAISKSTLNHPEMEQMLCKRVSLFDFGAKSAQQAVTFIYAIAFTPE